MRRTKIETVVNFIYKASQEEMYIILQEIIGVHGNLYVFDPNTHAVKGIVKAKMNGNGIQLEAEEWIKQEGV